MNKLRLGVIAMMAAFGIVLPAKALARADAAVATLRTDARPLHEKQTDEKKPETDKEKDKDEDKDKISVPVDKLPKAVVTGVKKELPGARITKAAKIEKENKVTYYLDNVKVGKKAWDVTVAEDGKILKKEECHDDD